MEDDALTREIIGCAYKVHNALADLWVDESVVLEVKAVQMLAKIHEVQLVNYLTATGINTGLVLNFGSSVQVKRKFREYTPKPLLNSIL